MTDDSQKYQYDQARKTLDEGTPEERRTLASATDADSEILYYLASDDETDVRLNTATNPSTPGLANRILAEDPDGEVRIELTRKIARLLPGLDDEEQEELWQQTVATLILLADDQLIHVREILADELKHAAGVPLALIRKLANDPEEVVSAPILEYSPLLSDQDLKEIIAAGIARGKLTAIARRQRITEELADAIVGTLEIPAIVELLANQHALIRDATMELIVEQAQGVPELHEPLALRPNLSVRTIKRIAGFVASSLVQLMIEKNDLPEKVAQGIIGRVRKRLARETTDDEDSIAARVADFHARGMLNDAFIIEGVESKQRRAVIHALARLAGTSPGTIDKILSSNSGRAVTSLAWKAGLSMRTALSLQAQLAFVPSDKFVAARDGIDFPFTEAEMAQEAGFFMD